MSRILRAILFPLAVLLALPMGLASALAEQKLETAIFAGGCFWCVEADFDKVDGVRETLSGYIGGNGGPVSYETHAGLGYREAVQIRFDPAVVSYERLVELFFRSVDPTDDGGQFCDRGHSYTTAIYAVGGDQLALAEQGRDAAIKALGRVVATEILPAGEFFPAEDYHQDFYRKNGFRYEFYRINCGRDLVLSRLWGARAWAAARH